MPCVDSLTFANNKGGSGKTFLGFQFACEAARANPAFKVLVVDLSLYSETSGLLMGGLKREHALAPTAGRMRTEENTKPETRAEGMVRDLVKAATKPESTASHRPLFGRWFMGEAPARETGPPDLLKYTVKPHDFNPRVPDNLYLIASAAASSWGEEHTGQGQTSDDSMDVDQEAPMWVRKNSTDWWPAAQQLKAALANLPGEWVAFFDTDHLSASPLTKLALGATMGTVVPLSLNQGDFARMFEDTTGNALFKDVMRPMQKKGMLSAPVRKLIFTKVASQTNAPAETEKGILSPFKPAKSAQGGMDAIAESLCAAIDAVEGFGFCLHEYDKVAKTQRSFVQKYFTAFKTVADVPLNLSTDLGQPLCTMRSSDNSMGALKPDKKQLNDLKQEINHVVASLLGATYSQQMLDSE